jgi:hypothetical protein
MDTVSASPLDVRAAEDLRKQFLAVVLPRLTSHAAVCLRGVRCPHERA